MTTESMPTPTPTKAEAAQNPRALARARKRRSMARFWREYRSHRSGLWGLAALVLIALVALFAPQFVGSDSQSVTGAPGGALESPSGEFPWEPTSSGAACWRCWCGAPGSR